MIKPQPFVLAMVLGLVLSACGGGNGGTPPPAATPTFTGVQPTSGPLAGATVLTLNGTLFTQGAGVTAVTVGGVAATIITTVDGQTVTCQTPTGAAPGGGDVVMTVDGNVLTRANAYTYIAPPMATAVAPDSGWETGGGVIAIRGTGFVSGNPGANTVTVGGLPCANINVVSDTQITCAVPAGSIGPAQDVVVGNANGTATVPQGFHYRSWPPFYNGSDARLDTDATPGQFASVVPRICCNGDAVHAVWQDSRNGTQDIYYNRSIDGGTNWLAADVKLDGSGAGSFPSLNPRICCSGDTVYVVWTDDRGNPPNFHDVYFNRSLDGGATWLPDAVRLDTDVQNAAESDNLSICCDGTFVYVAWDDARNGQPDIYFNRSADSGTNWLAADVRVDTDVAGAGGSTVPRICCGDGMVYLIWSDTRFGPAEIRANASNNHGVTWNGADLRVNAGADASFENHRICCSGLNVYVTWDDLRNGTGRDVFFNRSLDGGGTWGTTSTRLDTDVNAGQYGSDWTRLCCDGDNVYVTWSDTRNGSTDTYFNRSTDAGATWLATDKRLDTTAAGTSASIDLQICCYGRTVAVVWCDFRDGAWDCLVNTSLDAGVNWQPSDSRTDTDTAGAANSVSPQICCDGARIHVVWQEHRNGGGDVHVNSTVP